MESWIDTENLEEDNHMSLLVTAHNDEELDNWGFLLDRELEEEPFYDIYYTAFEDDLEEYWENQNKNNEGHTNV